MATGFVQRFKGKIAVPVGGLWIAGVQVNASAADLNTLIGGATGTVAPAADSTISRPGPSNLISGSAASVWTLGAPTQDRQVQLILTSVSSGIAIKAATGTSFGIYGGATEIVMKSTTVMSIALVGLSTTTWGILSAWSTSTAIIAYPTLSTTT